MKKLYKEWLRRSQGPALRRRPIRPHYALARLTPQALRQRVGWEGFWTFLGSKYCTAPARDTLWRLFHGGLYTADRLAHTDPRHSRLCCCCLHWVETGVHPLVCSAPQLVWNRVAWIGRDWLEELHPRGAAFLFTHAFVLPAEDSPSIVGSCLLQLLFVYTAHTLWRARVDTLHHGLNRTAPPSPS